MGLSVPWSYSCPLFLGVAVLRLWLWLPSVSAVSVLCVSGALWAWSLGGKICSLQQIPSAVSRGWSPVDMEGCVVLADSMLLL